MAKPDFRPFPAHKVIYHPAMMTAIGPVYRAVTLISITYWLAGCRELPNDATAFSAIVRTPNAHLTPIKSAILSVWSEIAPILKTDWEAGNQKEANVKQRGRMGGYARARMLQKLKQSQSTPPATAGQPHATRTEPIAAEMRRQIERAATKQNTVERPRLSDGSGSAGKSPEPGAAPAQAA